MHLYDNSSTMLDLSYLKEISGGNDIFIQKMLVHFTSDIPSLLSGIKEALDLGIADDLKTRAHKAKSIAGYLNDKPLFELMANIEADGKNEQLSDSTSALFESAEERFQAICKEIEHFLSTK